MKKVFLAFPTYQVKNKKKIRRVGGIEVWNLEKIDVEEFICLIQKAIKPLNRNVRINYFLPGNGESFHRSYRSSSWGILLPDLSAGNKDSRDESLLALNLYSNMFQPLMFSVGIMGISVARESIGKGKKSGFHGEDSKFTTKKFPKYYNELMPEIISTGCVLPDIERWDSEEWRLCIACLLYNRLEKYQRSYEILTWQSECADVVMLFESLLSRFKRDTGKFRIIQRLEVLLSGYYGSQFPEINEDLKRLFDYRNDFVHGSFFERLKKQTKRLNDNQPIVNLANIDFVSLERYKEIARKVLIGFLYLKKKFRNVKDKNLNGLTIPEIIFLSIMDTKLRIRIQKYVNEILNLSYF